MLRLNKHTQGWVGEGEYGSAWLKGNSTTPQQQMQGGVPAGVGSIYMYSAQSGTMAITRAFINVHLLLLAKIGAKIGGKKGVRPDAGRYPLRVTKGDKQPTSSSWQRAEACTSIDCCKCRFATVNPHQIQRHVSHAGMGFAGVGPACLSAPVSISSASLGRSSHD